MALGARRLRAVQAGLEQLYAQTDFGARLLQDPVAAVHRYQDPLDQELAGFISACFAYGRVSAFQPVVARILDWLDSQGGPRLALERLDLEQAHQALGGVGYRFSKGPDLLLLLLALHRTLDRWGSLCALAGAGEARLVLSKLVDGLRWAALDQAPKLHIQAQAAAELPAGFRYWMNHPESGSACKRLNMFLRWMVRPPTEGLDLGIWTQVDPAALVIPVDTHVLRTARFLGLHSGKSGNWRAAESITAQLRRMDPVDPVRYDFAIAHLGISGACKGKRDPELCPVCPLNRVCKPQ